MSKKTLLQIFLTFFLVLITFVFIKNYYKKDTPTVQTKENKIDEKEVQKTEKNLIKDISYTANNTKGDIYLLLASTGEIYLDDPNLMFLTKVEGEIKLTNGGRIDISSDFANFNNKTFETTFIKNVLVKRNEETIVGDELYLVLDKKEDQDKNNNKMEENIIRMSRNVFYKKPGYNLSADILEVDLITKNLKIYMLDKNNKIIAKTKTE
tara:strand:+ start:1843 stop:2469 length:627 start_codon:yes stop_codon:yes gene_type:complete